jgi:hypothetical protein
MYALSRRRGGSVSAFGAVLAGMLVFGALLASAAQATPTWHINGTAFSGSESTSWSGGPTTFKDAWNTRQINCTAMSGTTYINSSNADTGELIFSGCSVVGAPECVVNPLTMSVSGSFNASSEPVYETFTIGSSKWVIENCALAQWYTPSGTFKAKVGEEAVSSSRTLSGNNLTIMGSGWSISSRVAAKMTGVNAGKKFGAGGAWGPWVPFESAKWTIGGTKFTGSESIALSKAGAVTIKNKVTADVISCGWSQGKSLTISGGQFSSGQLNLQGCSLPAYPSCKVSKEEISLTTSGYIGRDEIIGKVRERLDLSGTATFSGSCPEVIGEGALPVGGSIAATLTSNGSALKKAFTSEAEKYAGGAPGMRIDGGGWSVTTEIEAVNSGANSGKALGAA